MANPPGILPAHSSLQLTLPQHATWMDSFYRSCQRHIAQQERWKAKGVTLLFLGATALTTSKCLFQAPLYALYNIALLRNPLTPFATKITEAATCAAFGLMQSCYLWCNATIHMDAISAERNQAAQAVQAVRNQAAQTERDRAALNQRNGDLRAEIQNQKDSIHRLREEIVQLKEVLEKAGQRRPNPSFANPERETNAKQHRKIKRLEITLKRLETALIEKQKTLDLSVEAAQMAHAQRDALQRKLQRYEPQAVGDPTQTTSSDDEAKKKDLHLEAERTAQVRFPQLPVTVISNPDASGAEQRILSEVMKVPSLLPESLLTVVAKGAKVVNVTTQACNWLFDQTIGKAVKSVIDADAQWKLYRYCLYEQHHNAFFTLCESLQNPNLFPNASPIEKGIIASFGKVYSDLHKIKRSGSDPRSFHQEFIPQSRKAYGELIINRSNVSQEFFNYMVKNSDTRFSTAYANTHYQKAVQWVAEETYPDLERRLQDKSFWERMETYRNALHHADSEITSPFWHVMFKKLDSVQPNYDPALFNHPSIIGTATYRNPAGHEKKVTLMRTHVPICGRSSIQNGHDQWWEHENQQLSWEYLIHCFRMVMQGKKMLIVSHLNPAELIEIEEWRRPPSWLQTIMDPEILRRRKEALIINLLRKMGRFFDKNIFVCLCSLDHPWFKALGKGPNKHRHQFIGELKDILTRNGSPFKMPSFVWSLDDEKNSKKDTRAEHELIKWVVDEVAATYFPDHLEFSASERMAFLNQFYSRIVEHLRFKHDIDFEQRGCFDAVDREEGIATGHLADAVNRTEDIRNPSSQMKVIGEVNGPALVYFKRDVIHSRYDFGVASVRHLEKIQGVKPPAIKEYELVSFDFHEDPTQRLTPEGISPGPLRYDSPPKLPLAAQEIEVRA